MPGMTPESPKKKDHQVLKSKVSHKGRRVVREKLASTVAPYLKTKVGYNLEPSFSISLAYFWVLTDNCISEHK
jgi:hypothetical protein